MKTAWSDLDRWSFEEYLEMLRKHPKTVENMEINGKFAFGGFSVMDNLSTYYIGDFYYAKDLVEERLMRNKWSRTRVDPKSDGKHLTFCYMIIYRDDSCVFFAIHKFLILLLCTAHVCIVFLLFNFFLYYVLCMSEQIRY